MDGLFGTDSVSLRPRDVCPLPSLPRRVLRHLISVHNLGIGSRILVGGDEALAVASLLERLGIEAGAVDPAIPELGACDAALWLDLEPRPAGERSLLSAAALSRTASLLSAVKPFGTFLLAARLGDGGVGHQAACLEAHLACFSERSRLTIFPERSFAGFFGGGARPAYAVASCHIAAQEPVVESDDVCCRWAAEMARESRAA